MGSNTLLGDGREERVERLEFVVQPIWALAPDESQLTRKL